MQISQNIFNFIASNIYLLVMESRRQSQVIRERAQRHNRLMKMINNYSLTDEEIKKLDRIKANTMMEINIRFLRSEQNRFYRFPLKIDEDSEDEQQLQINRKQNIIYDLRCQNNAMKQRSASNKVISLDSSQRIHSLDIERNQWQKDRIIRMNLKDKQGSFKQLKRNSFSNQLIKQSQSKLKLPQLIVRRERQNLKTEVKNPELQSIIGKKLVTQASTPSQSKKMKGLQRYLKHIDHHNLNTQSSSKIVKPKKMFLAEMD